MIKIITRKDFSKEQEDAFQYILAFLNSIEQQMVLSGYSGTGKSSLCNVLLDHFDENTNLDYICTAPTNEAVRVISKLTGRFFHKTIYSILGLALIDDDDGPPKLRKVTGSKLSTYDVIILDECSMVQKELFDLIQDELRYNSNIKIIYVGDDAQLPPVKDNGTDSLVFTIKNKIQLTQVQRTAKNNPIIKVATAIRNNLSSPIDKFERKNKLTKNKKSGIWFHKDRDEYLNLIFNDFKSEEYKKDSNFVRVLAYTNKTVNVLNKMIRREIFGKKDLPEFLEGDNLIVDQPVLDTDHEIIYTVGERLKVTLAVLVTDEKYGMKYWILHVKNYDISPYRIERELKIIHKEYIKQYLLALKELAMEAKKKLEETNIRKKNAWKKYFEFKRQFSWVKYSYAITTHKCVNFDTKIICPDGIIPINKLNKNDNVLSGIGNSRKINLKTYSGKLNKITIITKRGYSIDVSKDHAFLVSNSDSEDFKEVSKLQINDLLCISRKTIQGKRTPIYFKNHKKGERGRKILQLKIPKYLTKDIAWLLGVIIGDGCYSYKSYRVDFTNPSNKRLLNEYERVINSLGLKCTDLYKKTVLYSKMVESKNFRTFLEYFGLNRVTANYKKIPECIYKTTIKNKIAFISGLFDTDGCITHNKIKKTARFTTSSYELAKGLHLLLLSLGIVSTLSSQNNKHYIIHIMGNSLKIFKKQIKLRHDDKNLKLKHMKITGKTDSEFIPLGKKIAISFKQNFNDKWKIHKKHLYSGNLKIIYCRLQSVIQGSVRMSYNLLHEIYKISTELNLNISIEMLNAINNNYFYDPIKKIIDNNELSDMYDIEVNKDHSYVANGFVTHNSQGSTFQNIYVIESDCNKLSWNDIERNKLKYVAFTRASHLLRII